MRVGVCVIAHGSSKSEWIQLVDKAVSEVLLNMPIVTCFLEMVKGRTIQDGIFILEKKGVEHILFVPLFVSSGSTHIAEISHLLGLNKNYGLEFNNHKPLNIKAKVSLTSAMDDHVLISQLLIERAAEMSRDSAAEALLLVGHGSDIPGFKEKWTQHMQSLANEIQQSLHFGRIACSTLHPNNLRPTAENMALDYHLVVLPLFLSEGYFTNKVIPRTLEGIVHLYTGRTYLPSAYISRWIEQMVNAEVHGVIQ